MSFRKSILATAHAWLQSVIEPGDTVVDATAGNGHDTVFLAGLVGKRGKVFAFDVQEAALKATAERLHAAALSDCVQLVACGHECLGEYVQEPVRAAVFNLGYLPGSDKTVITKPASTLAALQALLPRLMPGGVVVLVVYTGHSGGAEESAALLDFLCLLPQAQFQVVRLDYLNRQHAPPYLIAVHKRIQAA